MVSRASKSSFDNLVFFSFVDINWTSPNFIFQDFYCAVSSTFPLKFLFKKESSWLFEIKNLQKKNENVVCPLFLKFKQLSCGVNVTLMLRATVSCSKQQVEFSFFLRNNFHIQFALDFSSYPTAFSGLLCFLLVFTRKCWLRIKSDRCWLYESKTLKNPKIFPAD